MLTEAQKEFRKLWSAALRSGAYKQTHYALHMPADRADDVIPEGFCCIGVAAHLAGTPVEDMSSTGDYLRRDRVYCKAREAAGFDFDTESQLIHLNDDEGKNFPAIADFIDSWGPNREPYKGDE